MLEHVLRAARWVVFAVALALAVVLAYELLLPVAIQIYAWVSYYVCYFRLLLEPSSSMAPAPDILS